MEKYSFINDVYKQTEEGEIIKEVKTIIYYKCKSCNHDILWVDEWDDEKKAEVQAKIDAHSRTCGSAPP